MGAFYDARDIADGLKAEGCTVEEVVSALNCKPDFDKYVFYHEDGVVYMEHEDGTQPTCKVCTIEQEAPDDAI